MSYSLGIDVGTTFTAAAICRESGRYAPPEAVPLGSRSAVVCSTVYLGQDGQVVVGEAAERRAVTEPDRVVRELTRRIGDVDPIVIGSVPHSAAEIAALVIRWVVDRAAHREGGPAQVITITYPTSWAGSKIQAVADALRTIDLRPAPGRSQCSVPRRESNGWAERTSTPRCSDTSSPRFLP